MQNITAIQPRIICIHEVKRPVQVNENLGIRKSIITDDERSIVNVMRKLAHCNLFGFVHNKRKKRQCGVTFLITYIKSVTL